VDGILLVFLACQPPFLRICSFAPALWVPPLSLASSSALALSSPPHLSALSAVIPCFQRFNALLEQPAMRLASRASPATVTISVVALCHQQRVQGGDQLYRQPLLSAVPYRAVSSSTNFSVDVFLLVVLASSHPSCAPAPQPQRSRCLLTRPH